MKYLLLSKGCIMIMLGGFDERCTNRLRDRILAKTWVEEHIPYSGIFGWIWPAEVLRYYANGNIRNHSNRLVMHYTQSNDDREMFNTKVLHIALQKERSFKDRMDLVGTFAYVGAHYVKRIFKRQESGMNSIFKTGA
jgi:hypothetical protein